MGVTLGVSWTLATTETTQIIIQWSLWKYATTHHQYAQTNKNWIHNYTAAARSAIKYRLRHLRLVYDVTTCYCIHPMHDKGALRFYDYCCRSSKDTIFQVYSNAGCLLSHYVASHLYLVMSILHPTWGLSTQPLRHPGAFMVSENW